MNLTARGGTHHEKSIEGGYLSVCDCHWRTIAIFRELVRGGDCPERSDSDCSRIQEADRQGCGTDADRQECPCKRYGHYHQGDNQFLRGRGDHWEESRPCSICDGKN